MVRKVISLSLLLILLTGCAGVQQSSGSPRPPATATGGPSSGGTSAPNATVAATPANRTPPAPTPAASAAASPVAGGTAYQDDRSAPDRLIQSYVNALNLKQYVRAYSYFESSNALPPYPQFEQAYSGTLSVRLSLGTITSGAGAGQIYYSVPVVLEQKHQDGSQQTTTACYILHQPQPSFFGAPPFRGMAIQSVESQQTTQPGSNVPATSAPICEGSGGGPTYTPASYDPADISATRYLDDRSDAIQLLRSLFNAVNSRQYVRAYSYWEAGQAVPYPQFEQGYADTAVVQLSTGAVTSDAGAGQLYYQVPVTLKSTTVTSTTQTFVGCYTVHLGRPEIQGAPPFEPLAIRSAKIQSVANDANTTVLMNQSCQP